MNRKTYVFGVSVITLFVIANLAWEFFTGGVPTHYLLHDDNMPGFSNWWGLLTIPAASAFLLWRIGRRMAPGDTAGGVNGAILVRFLWALGTAVAMSVAFEFGSQTIPLYLLITVLLLSFLFPLNRAEHFLGFIIGMLHTFGGVLPLIIGSVLLVLVTLAFKVRRGVLFLVRRIAPAARSGGK